LPELLFPWLVAACVGLAALHAAHISVQLVIDKVSPALKKWMLIFCALITIALYLYCLYIVADLFPIVKDEKSPILGVSLGTTYAAMSLLFFTLVVDQISEIFRQFDHLPRVAQVQVVQQGAA
jgi:TRAP-type C4-dicarboxylate transport system permease small subunit